MVRIITRPIGSGFPENSSLISAYMEKARPQRVTAGELFAIPTDLTLKVLQRTRPKPNDPHLHLAHL